jgi:hypothetical protein
MDTFSRPTLVRWLAGFVLGLVALPCAAQARLVTQHPHYLWLDGRFYVTDVPLGPTGAPLGPWTLHPRGSQGFFLHGFLTAQGCRRANGEPLVAETGSLRHAEVLDAVGAETIGLRREGPSMTPVVRLAICPLTVVFALRTAAGDAVCAGSVPAPFPVSTCPGLQALEPHYIFRGGFES